MEGGKRTTRNGAGPTPRVSVVTVVYNGAEVLEKTIQSVLAQNMADLEYIIIDGGSTDGTVDLIRAHEGDLEYWVSAKDRGIYDAMNKGIELCRGEWVGLINADDTYVAGALQHALDAAEGRPGVNIIHGDILLRYPDGTGKVKRAKQSGFLLKYWEMVLNHPSFLVRREYYRNNLFSLDLPIIGDHHWTLRAWLQNREQFLYLPEVMAHFAVGGVSMTGSLGRALKEGDRMRQDLGFSRAGRWLGRVVRIALYVPVLLKLRINRILAASRSK